MKLSIDLGGTNIRIAQVEKGNCLNKVSVPCLAQQDASTVLNQLSQLIRNMMNEQVDGIGIGVPSIVDPEKGIVYNVANISSWKEIHLKEILENEFKVAVAINNDSNCFTLGESLYGEGKSYTNMVGVTIGTGIGAGVVIGRRLAFMVGDRKYDVEAANELGCISIGVTYGYGTEAELKEADAEYICDDVDEIADVLDLEEMMVRR